MGAVAIRFPQIFFASLTLLALLAPMRAAACSPLPPVPMTEEERRIDQAKIEHEFVERARLAKAIVRVVALSTTGENVSRGDLLILEVLHGSARRGKVLRMKTVGTSLCGAGGFAKNDRGFIILNETEVFGGFLSPRLVSLLKSADIIH